MKHSLREERRRVEALAQRVRDDRASMQRHGQLLRERIEARVASPAGLLVCFAAGALLAPVAGAALRTASRSHDLRRLALYSAGLYRTFHGRRRAAPGATPGPED